MKIYEVLFNDTRQPEGDGDAVFLVRAPDFRTAIDEVMTNGSRENRTHKPHTVFEIGTELTRKEPDHPRILRGPYYVCGFNFGWREWRRKVRLDGPDNTNDWEGVEHVG